MQYVRIFVACLLVLVILVFSRVGWPASSSEPSVPKTPLRLLLLLYGEKLSLYFTVETIESSTLLDQQITPPEPMKEKDAFLDWLRRNLPETDVFPDVSFPEVVHVHENATKGKKDYAMDNDVSIQFKGTFRDLFKKLVSESNGTLAEDLNYTTNSGRFDANMPVDVNLKTMPLRTAMSAVLPRWSNPIIWTCFLAERNGHVVAFFKAAPSTKPSSAATSATHPDSVSGGTAR